MKEQIYGYQVQGSPSEGVYEAVSPAGEQVILYEWTPVAEHLAAAKENLATIIDETSCDAFSADGSLYLVANSADEGASWLQFLRSRGLFTPELSARPEPEEEPQEPVAQPEPAPVYRTPPPPPPPFNPPAFPPRAVLQPYQPPAYSIAPQDASPARPAARPPAPKKKTGCMGGCLGLILLVVIIFVALVLLISAISH